MRANRMLGGLAVASALAALTAAPAAAMENYDYEPGAYALQLTGERYGAEAEADVYDVAIDVDLHVDSRDGMAIVGGDGVAGDKSTWGDWGATFYAEAMSCAPIQGGKHVVAIGPLVDGPYDKPTGNYGAQLTSDDAEVTLVCATPAPDMPRERIVFINQCKVQAEWREANPESDATPPECEGQAFPHWAYPEGTWLSELEEQNETAAEPADEPTEDAPAAGDAEPTGSEPAAVPAHEPALPPVADEPIHSSDASAGLPVSGDALVIGGLVAAVLASAWLYRRQANQPAPATTEEAE